MLSQESLALGREAQLAAQQIGSGLTALRRANHAQTGYYTQAFFGLSIGLERLAKLVIIADNAIANEGEFPDNDLLRKIGHDVAALIDVCDSLSTKYRAGKRHAERPNDPIHQGIIATLTEFAKLSRYYNLDLVVQRKAGQALLPEPIEAWWVRVGAPILSKHYSRRQKERDKTKATAVTMLIGNSSYVLHYNEAGEMIDDVGTLMLHAGATNVVQKYGCVYTLQIVRWMALLISEVSHIGAYHKQIEPLLAINEPFSAFIADDTYFRDRRTWSIYP